MSAAVEIDVVVVAADGFEAAVDCIDSAAVAWQHPLDSLGRNVQAVVVVVVGKAVVHWRCLSVPAIVVGNIVVVVVLVPGDIADVRAIAVAAFASVQSARHHQPFVVGVPELKTTGALLLLPVAASNIVASTGMRPFQLAFVAAVCLVVVGIALMALQSSVVGTYFSLLPLPIVVAAVAMDRRHRQSDNSHRASLG